MAATFEQLSVTQQEMEAQKEQLVQEVRKEESTALIVCTGKACFVSLSLKVSHLHKQLLAEREGRQADKLEAATQQERWKQVSEAAKVKDEAIAVAEQIRDTSKNYLKQKDKEIEQLRLEVVSIAVKHLHTYIISVQSWFVSSYSACVGGIGVSSVRRWVRVICAFAFPTGITKEKTVCRRTCRATSLIYIFGEIIFNCGGF